MRIAIGLILLSAASLPGQAAECTCRVQGRDVPLGQSACLQTPKGARIATCGMVLNNTSWQFTDTPCVVSQAPETPEPDADTAGKRATLAAELRAGP
jgi:hypothetical protein